MATVHDVAKLFLSLSTRNEDAISNLKLQKLVYYAQGFHLALFNGQPLFNEKIEAWTHGPVVPELYHEYKKFGKGPIDGIEFDLDGKLSNDQIELIQEIYDIFGQFSAWKLRDMTHEESPWLSHESDAGEIYISEMYEYFKTRVH